jgi:hypothetical protein
MPDAGVAIVAADAFREQSQAFLQGVGPASGTAHEHAVQDYGDMIASATSLALSVELYLKALRILVGFRVPAHHDLWALFKGLPKELKESIERHYASLWDHHGSDVHTSVASVGSFSKEQLAETNDADGPQDNSLRSVLKRSKDAFQTWRYLHERGNCTKISEFSYEFYYLGAAADVMQAHAVAMLARLRSELPLNDD